MEPIVFFSIYSLPLLIFVLYSVLKGIIASSPANDIKLDIKVDDIQHSALKDIAFKSNISALVTSEPALELALPDSFSQHLAQDADLSFSLPHTQAKAPELLASKNSNQPKQWLTFILSVLVHVAIIAGLIFASKNSVQKLPIKVKDYQAIKSYLYQRPVKQKEKQNQPQAKVSESQQPITETKPAAVVREKSVRKANSSKAPSKAKSIKDNKEAVKLPTAQPEKKFSAYGQLKQLKNTIEQDMIDKDFERYTVKRSASKMHAAQIPVPHSQKQLTAEQKQQQSTSNYGAGKIIKNDNGTCIIEREQFLGSPVEATVSAFNCGESKFDKHFRQHMKKVQQKLTSTNRNGK